MKKKKFSIATLLLGIVFGLSLFFTDTVVYADVGDYKDVTTTVTITGIPKEEKEKIDKLAIQINYALKTSGYFKVAENGTAGLFTKTQFKDTDFISTKSVKDTSKKKANNTDIKTDIYTVTLAANWNLYNAYDSEQKNEIYTIVLSNIQGTKSKVNQATKIKIYNYFLDNDSTTANLVRQLSTDVTADFSSAYSKMKNWKLFNFFSTTFGVLAILIFLGLTMSILVDLAYITIPSFQLLDNGKEPPNFFLLKVSHDAWNSVNEAQKGNVKKNVVGIYFQTRLKQIVVICICLLYLTSGDIYTLIAWLIDSFQGLLPN